MIAALDDARPFFNKWDTAMDARAAHGPIYDLAVSGPLRAHRAFSKHRATYRG